MAKINLLHHLDERRTLALPGDEKATLAFSVDYWIQAAHDAMNDHGFFAVALSGGSTPKKIYHALASEPYRSRVDWRKVYLFWSDERSVPPTSPESNYNMAMNELSSLGIPESHIFRMVAEEEGEKNARLYEEKIDTMLGKHPFDLIMLGVGEDGHTASLFPRTAALKEKKRRVVFNHVPQKNTWRMTFTYPLINSSYKICFYLFGAAKASILSRVLTSPYMPEELPSQKVGTPTHPALWIADHEASQELLSKIDL